MVQPSSLLTAQQFALLSAQKFAAGLPIHIVMTNHLIGLGWSFFKSSRLPDQMQRQLPGRTGTAMFPKIDGLPDSEQ